MKVLFVSPSFYPALHYGGPIFINRSYCEALGKIRSVQLEVLTTDADGPRKRIDAESISEISEGDYAIRYYRCMFPPDIAPGLLFRLWGAIRTSDVVHLSGVYSFTTIPTLLVCRLMNKPVVWSTLGALQRWPGTTRTGVKKIWERVCNALSNPERVILHVTSEEEKAESIEKIPNAGVVVLRNGIELPEVNDPVNRDPGGPLRLLFIGRLHPIKGVENLLHALTKVNSKFHLSICGEGEPEYEANLRWLVDELGLSNFAEFHGRVDGDIKERHFREADLCVAPSHKEGFCTVVLESLARGLPVIAGHGTPWQTVAEMGCGWWVSNEPQELAKAIDLAAAQPLRQMGLRGRAWMERDFSWSHVAEETIELYRRLIPTAEVPQPELAGTRPA